MVLRRFQTGRIAATRLALVAAAATACADFAVDPHEPGADAADPASDGAGGAPVERGVVEVSWSWPGTGTGYWNVDQALRLEQKGGSVRWANHWSWTDEPDLPGGWLGIETDIDRIDGSHGDTAVFLLSNASAAVPGTGATCAAVGPESADQRCELPVELDAQTFYRLRIWVLAPDEVSRRWGGWFIEHETGEESQIAAIHVGLSHDGIRMPHDRIELLGEDADCSLAPMAVGYLANTAANQLGPGEYEHVASFAGDAATSACSGSMVDEFADGDIQGVVVSLGVP